MFDTSSDTLKKLSLGPATTTSRSLPAALSSQILAIPLHAHPNSAVLSPSHTFQEFNMRFAITFTATAALAATALAAPAAEPAPVCNGQDSNQNRDQGRPHPTAAATLTFPATCTAIVTSVATSLATSTVRVTETYTETYSVTSTEVLASTLAPSLPAHPKCVTDEDAEVIADIFRLLIQEYSDELALAALTEDFVDWASSVNILMNRGAQFPKNITGPTFSGRQAFMDGQGSQPQIPFTKLHIFHGCDSVSMNWLTERSAAGQKSEVASIVSQHFPSMMSFLCADVVYSV